MGITFREAVAEVELGLVAGDQLSDIATAGLLEGYESPALVMLAGQFGEPYDPVEAERLWTMALGELNLPNEGRLATAKLLVRAYARQVAEGELPPQLGASKISGVHRLTAHAGCDGRRVGDCIGAGGMPAVAWLLDSTCSSTRSLGFSRATVMMACGIRLSAGPVMAPRVTCPERPVLSASTS